MWFRSNKTGLEILLFSAFLLGCSQQHRSVVTTTFDGPHDVLVAGQLTVDVMELAASRRFTQLAGRLQKAARENPTWWLDHSKKSKPGEPLPYDARTGLSEDEYREFLALKMTVRKQGEAKLNVKSDDLEEVFILDGGEALADLTGIEIDIKNNVVRTPFGVLTERTEIDVTDEGSALGAWVGTQWKLENPDANGITGTVVKVGLGKVKKSGRCVVLYDVKRIKLDAKMRISHILMYDVPRNKIK